MTLNIFNWFHDREGELFTVDETPFTREKIVQVVNDSVDPVQQVLVEGEKYIGVISYEEHNGWYEYTRWDDAAGEVNMGVCAKCVADASSVNEVSRTLGDSTDIAQEKFENHYSDQHTVKPDKIETGATLLNGTTVNGNEAIHPGMDGSGSGVDADFVLGNEALQTGSFYSFSENQGKTESSQFSSPGNEPRGVGIDSSDCIWNAVRFDESIYQFNQTGTVLSQFSSPGNEPRGVGIDSSDCIWNADSGSTSIYKLNQNGIIQSQFSTPSNGSSGVGVDSNSCIWHADFNSQSIYQFNQTGTVQSQFFEPGSSPTGVGFDSTDSLWNADAIDNSIYKLNKSGVVQNQFSAPGSFPTGIDFDSSDCIWHADANAGSIYKLINSVTVQF